MSSSRTWVPSKYQIISDSVFYKPEKRMDLSSCKLLFTSISLFWVFFFYIFPCMQCARTKRTLAFTNGNSFGYLAAVAIPIEIPNRNLYVAFNLETNYGLPPNDTHYDLIKKWNLSGMFSDIGNNVTRIDGRRKKRSLYNRSNFYQCVSGYFELFGMNGTQCLLRTICEVAESRLYASNGVLGSIMHILFMPTSSAEEYVPSSMYEAEELGREEKCHKYKDACPEGLLGKISIAL